MPVPARDSKLFQPIKVGNLNLSHRIVLAPLTRTRADQEFVPHEIAAEYYAQRANTPGSLLITEATHVSHVAGGADYSPGLYTEAHVEGWKKVTEAVHAKGSFIFAQIWAQGRTADPELQRKFGFDVIAPSPIPLTGRPPPHALTIPEIKDLIHDFVVAAQNAIRAGFDGVEIHGANGYLVDQFLQESANHRTDEYGGSVENRTRFPREVIGAVADAIGESKVGLRLSPWSTFGDARKPDSMPTFLRLIKALIDEHPNLAYLNIVEPGITGYDDTERVFDTDSSDTIRELWQPRPFISGGGYTTFPERAVQAADEKNVLVAYGRAFISNPDLVERVRNGIAWTPYDRSTFYRPGPTHAEGYTDYPFATDINTSASTESRPQ